MTYAEAVQFLYDLRMFGAKFGLENTFKLAALAGKPQEKLRFIHVAGTNGKGSTCAFLESIYRAAGLRVGLFTSPHLVSFAERIQVNRELIAETEIVRLVAELQELLKQFPVDAHPTFFEVVAVMALKYFAEQECDLVIWETGMGGRLDATNIVTPLVTVITNVEFDHEKWLGSTLAEIAMEKAGIIKPGIPVLTAASEPDALNVIIKTAREKNSPLTQIGFADTKFPPLDKIVLPLPGEHQRLNAALAIATARILNLRPETEMGGTGDSPVPSGHWPDGTGETSIKEQGGKKILGASSVPSGGSPLGTGQWPVLPVNLKISVSENAIRDGLLQVRWPGRFQQIKIKSGQTILLDGAHNPSGAMALREAIAKYFPGEKPALILGVLQDKEWKRICEILGPIAEKLFLVPVSSDRTATPDDLEKIIRNMFPNAQIATLNSLSEAFRMTANEAFVVVTGSLYLVGEALELLEAKHPVRDERGLNEWSAPQNGSNQTG